MKRIQVLINIIIANFSKHLSAKHIFAASQSHVSTSCLPVTLACYAPEHPRYHLYQSHTAVREKFAPNRKKIFTNANDQSLPIIAFRTDNPREPVKFDKRGINTFDYAPGLYYRIPTYIESFSYLLYKYIIFSLFFSSGISRSMLCYMK